MREASFEWMVLQDRKQCLAGVNLLVLRPRQIWHLLLELLKGGDVVVPIRHLVSGN